MRGKKPVTHREKREATIILTTKPTLPERDAGGGERRYEDKRARERMPLKKKGRNHLRLGKQLAVNTRE